MKKGISLAIFLFSYLLALFAINCGIEKETSPEPIPWQNFENKFQISVIGFERMKEWRVVPNEPSSFGIGAKDGYEIAVVKIAVIDIKTRKIDKDQYFGEFEVEDLNGNKYESPLKSTDVREIPFLIPVNTKLKTFHISGLTFDIESFAGGGEES